MSPPEYLQENHLHHNLTRYQSNRWNHQYGNPSTTPYYNSHSTQESYSTYYFPPHHQHQHQELGGRRGQGRGRRWSRKNFLKGIRDPILDAEEARPATIALYIKIENDRVQGTEIRIRIYWNSVPTTTFAPRRIYR